MTDVESFMKDNKGECGCGCGLYGALKKPNRKGVRCVSRQCKCSSCGGRRSNKGGHAKQNAVAKRLGINRGRFLPSNEEHWGWYFDVEVKALKQVGPVQTWWNKAEAQVLANRPDFGDRRKPIMFVAMPEGTSDGLVVLRLSAWEEHVGPALDEYYGSTA